MEKMKNLNKNLKILVIVTISFLILVSITILSFIYLTNSKDKESSEEQEINQVSEKTKDQEDQIINDTIDSNEDWVRHTFSKLGFSIKVPREWGYISVPARSDQTVVEFYDDDKNNIILKIRHYPGSYGWCEKDTLEEPTDMSTTWEEIQIDGQTYQISWCGDTNFMIVENYMQSNELEFTGTSKHKEIDIIKNIISTIEFL